MAAKTRLDLSKAAVRQYLRSAIHEVLYDCEMGAYEGSTIYQLVRICAAAEQAIQHAEERERQAAAESRGWDGVEAGGDE
jgi:hypothetical protein